MVSLVVCMDKSVYDIYSLIYIYGHQDIFGRYSVQFIYFPLVQSC